MSENVIDDIKVVLSADDKAAKGPIDDLIAKLDGIGKAAEGNGNATKEFFDRIAKGGEEAAKSMGKLADAAGKSGKGVKNAGKDFSEVVESAERVVPAVDKAKTAIDGMGNASEKIKPFGRGEQYLAFLDGLADKAIQAGSALGTKLAGGAKKAGKWLAKLAVSPLTMPIKAMTGAISNISKSVGKLFSKIKSVIMYRAIRSAIRMVTDGFKEGTQNAYQWSKAMGGQFAASMDMLATSSLYLKNSLGAMVTPLINAVAPAIDYIIDKFVALLNVANQVIALLTGAKTWTKAIKYPKEYAAAAGDAAGGAGKLAKAMTTILAIDELNPLNGDKGGGGGGGGGGAGALDYSQMFEEVDVASQALEGILQPFVDAWAEKGQGVVDSIHNAMSGLGTLFSSIGDSFWEVWMNGTGQETIEHILGIFTGINNTIGNISRQLAEGWNTDNLGTQIIQNIWNILNNILGLWDRIANATAKWAEDLDFVPILNAFNNLSGALERLSKVVTDSLGDAWENVILPLGKWLIESGLPAAIDAIAKAIDFVAMALETLIGILKEIKQFIDDLMNMPLPDFLKSFFGGSFANGMDAGEFAGSVGAATFGVKFSVTDIIDKIPIAKKILGGFNGQVTKKTDKIPLKDKIIGALTGNITKRTLGEKTKAPVSLAANMVKRTLGDKVVLPIPNLTGNITKRTLGGKITAPIDSVTNITGRKWGSENVRLAVQQPQAAINVVGVKGMPGYVDTKVNFTGYDSDFSKVKMALQITEAYGPNGNRIQLNENGGAFYGGKWHDIAQYATGGVPNHGSLFMAGEAGAEIVGHVGGRTEVLNQSQIASTIAAATQMSNASQNNILMQLLNGVEQLVEGQGDVRAYIPAGEVVSGLQRNNRRDGRALVPMGV